MASSRKPKTIDPDKIDPSVYYYDEVYDDIKQEEQESERESRGYNSSPCKGTEPKGSKYIAGLKETAELRKTEKELRKFKKYAKDRREAEAQGDVSQEDVYVSDSYKRKLSEIKKLEADKRQRLEREQDNTMNFMKHSKNDRVHCTSSSSLQHQSESKYSPPDESRRSVTPEPVARDRQTLDSSDKTTKRRRPRTIEERRQYLREVLKKRTVGKVYEEAVQRYIQRKALSAQR